MEIKVKRKKVIGEVQKTETQKIVVELIDSNLGENVAITDMYLKDGEWKVGKGKWIPAELADDVVQLIGEAYECWEEDNYEEEEK